MYLNTDQPLKVIEQIQTTFTNQTMVISVAEASSIDLFELISELNKAGIQYIGGIFPKVISNNKVYNEGIILSGFSNVKHTFLVTELDRIDFEIEHFELEGPNQFLFTFADGLTKNLSLYLDRLYNNYGGSLAYFGAGTGSLTLQQIPSIFNKDGIFQDAAVGLISSSDIALGVKHGWKKVSGPFIVTKADQNLVKQINWQKAFEVYQTIIKQHSEKEITAENFFEISKAYPFGILKDSSEYVVRDPIDVNENGDLICIGEVIENTVVDILNGDAETLINAATEAAKEVLGKITSPKHAYVSDCISRVLFLEEEYEKELLAISEQINSKDNPIPIEGALSIGEISSFGDGYLQLFNKTVIIGLFN
ncbi:FIST signal transduction protein [Algoriphagus pacificus]|uniref:FIST C-terminal domain-containing protein n=1 Tax=Algoriphagus pacificus TaxID=2811234 RepID=A0ABS3CN66_9BACT|nr:FIST C-terminal domain-containing protein [Algoriphagus pacificus]MBN7817690.1 FIST C-terminal domain-containing protein [Algoriphagus pacificus]